MNVDAELERAVALDSRTDCRRCDPRLQFKFPSPDEVWEQPALKESEYDTTVGWSGKSFGYALTNRAGILTSAREPSAAEEKRNAADLR
jgi:hypothetical protein